MIGVLLLKKDFGKEWKKHVVFFHKHSFITAGK